MFTKTINDNQLTDIHIIKEFINDGFDISKIKMDENPVVLIKVDIEGYELVFIDKIDGYLRNKKVQNLIIEISPKFNDRYPEMC